MVQTLHPIGSLTAINHQNAGGLPKMAGAPRLKGLSGLVRSCVQPKATTIGKLFLIWIAKITNCFKASRIPTIILIGIVFSWSLNFKIGELFKRMPFCDRSFVA